MAVLPEPAIYTPESIAQFLMNNAGNADEYRWAVEEAVSLGVDVTALGPEVLIHEEP